MVVGSIDGASLRFQKKRTDSDLIGVPLLYSASRLPTELQLLSSFHGSRDKEGCSGHLLTHDSEQNQHHLIINTLYTTGSILLTIIEMIRLMKLIKNLFWRAKPFLCFDGHSELFKIFSFFRSVRCVLYLQLEVTVAR